MQSSAAIIAISSIFFFFGLGSLILGSTTFIILKDVAPISKRPKVFSVIVWFAMLGIVFQMYLGSLDVLHTCWRSFIWRMFFPNVVIGLALRALGLYRVFIWHRNRNNEEDLANYITNVQLEEDDILKEKIEAIRREQKALGWRSLIKPYIIFHLIQVFLVLASIVQVMAMGGTFEETCSSPFILADDILNALVMLAVIGFFIVKLRKVHDDYWIKYEFFWIAGISIVFGVGGLVIQLLPPVKIYGTMMLHICFSSMAVVSYGVPSVMAIRNQIKENSARTSTFSASLTDNNVSSSIAGRVSESRESVSLANIVNGNAPLTPKWSKGSVGNLSKNGTGGTAGTGGTEGTIGTYGSGFVYFKRYPKIARLYHKKFNVKNIKDYMEHIQDEAVTNAYTCLEMLKKWSEEKTEAKVGIAILRIQKKHLLPDSYLPVSVSKSVLEKINLGLSKAEEALTSPDNVPLPNIDNLFDDLQLEIEEFLASNLFHGFLKSQFFAKSLDSDHLANSI